MAFYERYYFTPDERTRWDQLNKELSERIGTSLSYTKNRANLVKALGNPDITEEEKSSVKQLIEDDKENFEQIQLLMKEIDSIEGLRVERYYSYFEDKENRKELLFDDIKEIINSTPKETYRYINKLYPVYKQGPDGKTKKQRATAKGYREFLWLNIVRPVDALDRYGLLDKDTQEDIQAILKEASLKEYKTKKTAHITQPSFFDLQEFASNETTKKIKSISSNTLSLASLILVNPREDRLKLVADDITDNYRKQRNYNTTYQAFSFFTQDGETNNKGIIKTKTGKKPQKFAVSLQVSKDLGTEIAKTSKKTIKIFNYIKQRIAIAPNLFKDRRPDELLVLKFPLENLQELGYSNNTTARKAFNDAKKVLMSLRYTKNISNGKELLDDDDIRPFSRMRIFHGECQVYVLPYILEDLYLIPNLPAYFNKLSANEQIILGLALEQARRNKESTAKNDGKLNITIRTIVDYLGLTINEKNIRDSVISPITTALKNLADIENKEHPEGNEIKYKIQMKDKATDREILEQGTLSIELSGGLLQSLKDYSFSREEKQQKLQEKREKKRLSALKGQ